MGDALSPGMTIGTCGWMEREWMRGIDDATKRHFMARRYMDDVLLLMRKYGWDKLRFYDEFKKSECYMPPLRLEEAADGTFLETSFDVSHHALHALARLEHSVFVALQEAILRKSLRTTDDVAESALTNPRATDRDNRKLRVAQLCFERPAVGDCCPSFLDGLCPSSELALLGAQLAEFFFQPER